MLNARPGLPIASAAFTLASLFVHFGPFVLFSSGTVFLWCSLASVTAWPSVFRSGRMKLVLIVSALPRLPCLILISAPFSSLY